MMRKLPNGETRFCYGLFSAALITSAVLGVILVSWFGDAVPDQRMALWVAAAIGGNLGPLLVDLFRRTTKF